MRSSYLSITAPQFRVLSDGQIEDIHQATLEVLKRTGARVYHEEGLALMRKAGASISDGNLVRIPPHLVEWAIRTAPSNITIYTRDGKPAMYLTGTNVYYGTGPSLPNIRDPYTGERRLVKKQDVANVAKLVDALPNISYVMSMAIVSDCTVGMADREEFEAMVLNTSKPIVGWAFELEGYKDIISMGIAVRGSLEELQHKPFFVLYAEPSSPLMHSEEAVDKLLYMAERHLPCLYTPGVLSGASSPVTNAGTIVIDNCELLAGLVLAQLKREGAPCIFGGGSMPLDLRTTNPAFGSPESWLNHAALAELARYYKLPSWGFGGVTDAKVFDEQASLEGALSVMAAALSGANLVHDVGYIESGLTGSLEMVAVQDEVIGMVKRFMQGVEVSEETLAVDAIDEVGPGGHFLSSPHTLRHCRETYYPALMDRRNYQEWLDAGQKTLGQRANEKVRDIIENYQPEQLSGNVKDRIRQVMATADEKTKALNANS